jgi:Cysteine-rich CPXCG
MAQSESREDMDEEFLLGEGTADTAATVYCPYCNEPVEISLDAGGGGTQDYVEDCQVCCQPWTVSVRYGADGSANVSVTPLEGQ